QIGDFDLDGHLDVVTNRDWLRGFGDGTFARWSSPVPAADRVAFADVNGDGQPDAVTARDRSIVFSLRNGLQTFGQSVTLGIPFQPGGLAVFDADGDARVDVLATDPVDNTLVMLHGNGDGTFASPVTGVDAGQLAFADFNRDGMDDA